MTLILLAQTAACVGPLGIPAIASLIRADLGLTLTQAGSFLSAYYIGPIVMSVPAGTLADTWGVARTLILGQVVIAGGLLAASAAGSYPMVIALLIVAGLGYGMLNPTSTKAAMGWFPPRQRATVVGIKQIGLPAGGVIGAALLPALALAVGWRLAVAASAALILVMIVASVILYRDPPGEILARPPGAKSPLRTVLAMRDPWLVGLASLVFAAMQTVWMAFLVLYLEAVVGLPLLVASAYLALAQLAGAMGRIVFGLLSDRVFAGDRRLPLLIAGAGSTLCSIAMAFTGPGASAAWLVPLVFVFGLVGIGWNGVHHTLMAELAGPAAAGTAVGLGLALSSIGVTAGPPLFGRSVELMGGLYRPAWLGLAGVMVLAMLVLLAIRERRGMVS
ncbi:MAG: MFS transporter [Candidatus Rokubacteria bacterium]|nr:MFS transporter [Candidatus Rokubacteria bacterium]